MINGWIVKRHTLTNQSLGTGKTDSTLVGQKFAYRADTTAAQMIDIIRHSVTLAQFEEIAHGFNNIFLAEDAVVDLGIETKFLLDFVATNTTEIVAFGIEEETLQHASGILNGWRIARTEFAIDVLEGLLLIVGGIALQGFDNGIIILGVDHLDAAVTRANEVTDDCGRERFVSTGDDGIPFANIGKQHLGAHLFLIKLVRELQRLNFVEKGGDFLVGRIP